MFGRDVGFTYGPLAYLTLPMPFGSNLEQGVLFQLISWIALAALLGWFAVSKRISTVGLLAFAICAPAFARMISRFGYAGPDLFIEFLVFLLLGATLIGSAVFYFVAIAVTALLLLIKVSTGLAAVGAMLAYAAGLAVVDRSKGLRLLAAGVGGIAVAFGAAFLVFGGPADALVPYVKSALEISSGFSSALSLPGPAGELYFALAIFVGFLAFSVTLFLKKDRAFPMSVAVLAPLFLEFKHSFMRQDGGHIEFFFTFAAFALAATVLFSEIRFSRDSIPALAAIAIVAAPWLYFEQGRYWIGFVSPVSAASKLRAVSSVSALNQTLSERSAQALASDRLDPKLLARIGKQSVTIYPWENAYAAANNIDYRPLPVFQSYQAYTSYLDGWNAQFLNDATRRPEFVIFEWNAIDGRHPLLDCPQTMVALYRNYEFDSQYGSILLLRKRSASLPGEMAPLKKTSMRVGEPVHVSEDHTTVVHIFLRHNISGSLRDLFFRIDEVEAMLSGPRGRTLAARIPPAVLDGGIVLNIVPEDFEDARRLFESATVNEKWDTIAIGGPGISSFAPVAEVEIDAAPGVTVSARPGVPSNLTSLHAFGELSDMRIEMLNSEGVSAISEREVVELSNDRGYTTIHGWAVPTANEKRSLYVDVDGHIYPASWESPRVDVEVMFGAPARNSGFTAAIPNWMLGTAVHRARLVEVSEDQTAYWPGDKVVSFRIVPSR